MILLTSSSQHTSKTKVGKGWHYIDRLQYIWQIDTNYELDQMHKDHHNCITWVLYGMFCTCVCVCVCVTVRKEYDLCAGAPPSCVLELGLQTVTRSYSFQSESVRENFASAPTFSFRRPPARSGIRKPPFWNQFSIKYFQFQHTYSRKLHPLFLVSISPFQNKTKSILDLVLDLY